MRKILYVIAILLLSLTARAQQKTVTGTVKNKSDDKPIANATIQVKGSTTATQTNDLGVYTITVPNDTSTLLVSFVGFEPTELQTAGTTTVDFLVNQLPLALNAVVVTGYTSQRKVDLTGAVSVVDLTEVKDIPTGNPMRALQGRVPGLYVEADGAPNGGNKRILIRGLNTLGDPNPLYIIDGVPTKRPNVFTSLNPSSIASVQVLKDASAASLYGARASNGVIVVTTKEGKLKGGKEKTTVQFNTSLSAVTEKPWREKVLNAEQRGRALWQASVNDRTNPDVHQAIYTYDWNGDYNNPVLNKVNIVPFVGGDQLQPAGNTNWQDEVYEKALITQQDLSISAGTGKSSLLINLGYFKNTGMMVYTNYERYSARLNSYTTFFDSKVKVGQNLMMVRSSETLSSDDLGGSSAMELALVMAPTIPVFRKDGTYAGPIGAGYSDRNNPVHMQYINRWDKKNELIGFGNVYAEITPIKNLVFRTSYGIDYSNLKAKNIEPTFVEGFLSRNINSLAVQQTDNLSQTWTNTASYQFEAGDSKVSAIVGTEAIREDIEAFGAFRENFAIEDEDYYVLNAGTGRSTNNGTTSGYRLFSIFGKLNYGFSDRYLASLTLRRDGSSRFGSANKYGVFPAATIGWRINNEEFFSKVDVISNLKIRAGVGRVGNQEIGNVARLGLFQANYGTIGTGFPGDWQPAGTAYDLIGGNQGTLPSGYVQIQAENQNLKWESTDELNIGVDFGLLNEKISGSFDFFTRKAQDILIQPPIASAVGEGRQKWLNGATKTNRGWELLIGYHNSIGGLNYSISGNASHFKDKITVLPPEVRTAYPGNAQKSILGQSQLAIFGYETDGIFQNQAEVDTYIDQPGKGIGRIRYKDLNSDKKIDAFDQDWLGTLLPTLEYGIRIDLDYKNFDLSIFGSGVAGKTGNDPLKPYNSFVSTRENNGPGVLDAWTPQNASSKTPRLSLVDVNDESRQSDFFMLNGSYFRLRNVQLGYNLSKTILSRVNMEGLRIFLIGQNLFAIKDKEYVGKDPEKIGGRDNWPTPTIYTLGLNVTF